MDKLKIITLSDTCFHQRVFLKYRKGKRNPFWLPLMIFYKNRGSVLFQRINTEILLRFNHHDRRSSSVIVKGVQDMRRLISWFRDENPLPKSRLKPFLLKSIRSMNKILPRIQQETASGLFPIPHNPANTISEVSFIQSVFSRAGRMLPSLTKVVALSSSRTRAVFYPQAAYNLSLPDGATNRQRLSSGNFVQILKPQIYTILSQDKSLLNNKSLFNINKNSYIKTSQNWTISNKPFIKHYQYNPGSDFAVPVTSRRRPLFNSSDEPRYPLGNKALSGFSNEIFFRNQRKIEQEFEEIKKVMVETKEAVTERPVATSSLNDTDIKKHLDINRISDQVYQNIERRIRIERGRRGI